MPLRGLTAEQLFDSLSMATGFRDAGRQRRRSVERHRRRQQVGAGRLSDQVRQPNPARQGIADLDPAGAVADERQGRRRCHQSLEQSETLAAIADAPFLTTTSRIDTLYLATLARRPRAKELERATLFIEDAVRRTDSMADQAAAYNSALADVFWALLNSSEFTLNH